MDIKELLTIERVAVRKTAPDWEAAVRAVGQLLVDSGAVEPRYIDSMIQTTRELGPYIVIAPGLAIPHGRPEEGVRRPCMAVLTLDPPVEFGNKDNDPVSILVALGATDAEQHVQALQQMAETLSEPANMQALVDATTPEEVTRVMWSGSTVV